MIDNEIKIFFSNDIYSALKKWCTVIDGLQIPTTVKCCYNAVQYNTIIHTSLQWLRQNINQGSLSQKTPHISP